ncbi:bifunctional metallophosphatase/5'-nucleotidase [Haloferacaceae archaeon DSL9]
MVRLLQYSDIENVYDDPARAARFAGLLSWLDGDDALVVGTGDNTAPGVASLIAKGRQALSFYRAVGTDVETFGNHDFDYGPDETRRLLADAPQTWVSANVYDEAGEPFGAEVGVVPWTIEEVDGARIGLFGVTDPATDSLNPMAAALTFSDPYEAAENAVAALRNEGVDHVVALSHLGAGDDELAARVDVDAVLGGHVHSTRLERANDTLLTRPGVNAEQVIEVRLDGESATGAAHDFDPAADAGVAVDGGSATDALEAELRRWIDSAGLDEVVATVDDPIERTSAVVHGGECRIGNFVADAYRWAADADVGLQNSGGIRSGPPLSGEITVADLISVIPFEEPVVEATVTGAELLAIFEEIAAAGVDFGADGWWHGHVAGAELDFEAGTGDLVSATVAEAAVDPERRYTVATAEYLLHSDHEFPTLMERHRTGEYDIQHEALAAYARAEGIAPAVDGRLRQHVTRREEKGASLTPDGERTQ